MSVVVNIISAVIKSVVGDKIGNELINEVIGISIDGVSEKGINKISDFINGEKAKIEHILSKENMESLNISEENIDFVVAEIKDLLSEVEITDEVLRQYKYDNKNLSIFLWNVYCEEKNDYIECESEVKKGVFAVSKALIKLVRESEEFENNILVQISNTVDDTNVELQKISEYMKTNFSKLDDNSQLLLNILLTILEQIQKMNMQGNETKSTNNEGEKFKNNKKQDYIKNWYSRLFLHVDNEENPITLADAFIMPDYRIWAYIKRIGFFINNTLEQTIEKFIDYNETSTMLIIGVPGMGKTTVASWLADKYKMNNNVMILRFRDWESDILNKGILKTICKTLACKKEDLENRVLILDGFDEMKSLHMGEKLLNDFLNNLLDYENIKCIITSRPNYINSDRFQNILEIKTFDANKIELFCKRIMGGSFELNGKIEENLDVLGIPVILYMAVMSGIDIAEKATKPQLYTLIFAKKGGVFDRFSHDGVAYSKGAHIMRNGENTKKYLEFLQEVAFKMFEKNKLSLSKSEYKIPELAYEGNLISVLEFPIKYLFENTSTNIEFIHNSIYEYFASEYLYNSIADILNKDGNIEIDLARVFGSLLKSNQLSPEILEFLKYRIYKNKFIGQFDKVNRAFQLMLRDGMTYYLDGKYKQITKCEKNIFANMLEVIHLFRKKHYMLNFDEIIINYLDCCDLRLNLSYTNLSYNDLYMVQLRNADLSFSSFKKSVLTKADLSHANLCFANFVEADLTDVNLKGAELSQALLIKTKLDGSIWMEDDIQKVLPVIEKACFSYIILEDELGLMRKIVHRNELLINGKNEK